MKRVVVAGLFAGIVGSPSAFAGFQVYDVEKWPSDRNGLIIRPNPQLPVGLITCRVIAVQQEKPPALQSDELTLDPRTDSLVCGHAQPEFDLPDLPLPIDQFEILVEPVRPMEVE